MAANILTIEYAKANQALTGNLIRAVILCDTVSDLPAVNSFTNYELIQGSKAIVIEDNTEYRMNSAGNWFLSGDSFVDVYTKQQIDSLLDDKQDELTTAQLNAVNSGITAEKLTTDEAALSEVIDNAAKNLFQITGTTSSPIVTVNADQTVTVSGTPSSGNISFAMGQFTGEVGKSYHLSGCPSGGSSNTWRLAISDVGYDYGTGLDFVGDGSEHTVTLFVRQSSSSINITAKPMICTAADWAVSQKYVPYAPTNKELYDTKVDKARPSIPSGSNLDDYKQVGHFKVTSSSTAATITNTPFTVAGYILDVDYWYQIASGATGYIQTAITNAANTLIEKKRIYQYQNGAWSWTPWVTIYSISVPT